MIPAGIAIVIPEGCFGMVCPRSGLAAKFGLTILNAPGIIDSDYRGELKNILTNLSSQDFVITDGMRIAQLLIMKYVCEAEFQEVTALSSQTARGSGGFGSTGL